MAGFAKDSKSVGLGNACGDKDFISDYGGALTAKLFREKAEVESRVHQEPPMLYGAVIHEYDDYSTFLKPHQVHSGLSC